MTALERYAIEAAAVVLCIAGFVGWWSHHNHAEQSLGAQNCIQSSTETKAVAVAGNVADQTVQTAILQQTVITYDKRVADLNSTNSALAERLRNLQGSLYSSAMPHPGAAAGGTCPDPGLSKSESAARERLGRVLADVKPILDACDANQSKVEGAATLYASLRDRALKAAIPEVPSK